MKFELRRQPKQRVADKPEGFVLRPSRLSRCFPSGKKCRTSFLRDTKPMRGARLLTDKIR
jgi:hypothetical protein